MLPESLLDFSEKGLDEAIGVDVGVVGIQDGRADGADGLQGLVGRDTVFHMMTAVAGVDGAHQRRHEFVMEGAAVEELVDCRGIGAQRHMQAAEALFQESKQFEVRHGLHRKGRAICCHFIVGRSRDLVEMRGAARGRKDWL